MASMGVELNIQANPSAVQASNSSPVCEGFAVQLQALSTGAVSYAWYADAGLTNLVSSQQNPSLNGLMAGVYTYYVQARNGACVSPVANTTVTVTAAPPAPQPLAASVCEGDSLRLQANAAGFASYSWSGPAGFVSNLQNPIIANASQVNAGAYRLTVTNAQGCSAIGTVQATVFARPQTPVLSPNVAALCEGDTLNLSVSPAYVGTMVSYQWTTPQGGVTTMVPSLQIAPALAANSGAYTVRVLVDGCLSLPNTANVTVNPAAAAPQVAVSSPVVCEGETFSLSTSTMGQSYSWTGPNGYASMSPNPVSIVASSQTAGVYSLRVRDAAGCLSAPASVTVTVNLRPVQPSIATVSEVCPDSSFVLSTSSIANTYIWVAPNGADTTTNTSSVRIVNTSSLYMAGAFSLRVIDANGCSSLSSIPTLVNLQAVPNLQAFNDGPVCLGDSIGLFASTITGANYTWYADAGLSLPVSLQQNPRLLTQQGQTVYYVQASLGACVYVASTTVTFNTPSAAPIIVANADTLCEGSSLILSTPNQAARYLWTGPNGFSSQLQQPMVIEPISPAGTGRYSLQIPASPGVCASEPAFLDVFVIPVLPSPVLAAVRTAICEGDSLILTTTAQADTFLWTAPDGRIITTTQPSLRIATGSSFYLAGNWSLRLLNAGAACPSLRSNDLGIVINSNTQPPLVINSGPVCIGGSVTLSTQAASGASYRWYADTLRTQLLGFQASLTLNGIVSDTTFYLEVESQSCTSPLASTRVLIRAQPAAPVINANQTAICEDGFLSLSTPTQANAYQWFGPAGFQSTLANPSVVSPLTLANAGVYRLTVFDVNNCASEEARITITVNPLPPAPTIYGNTSLCFGDTLSLQANYVCNQAAWISPLGDTLIGTGLGLNVLSSDAAYVNGLWRLRCSDANGCAVSSNPLLVEIKTVPVISAFNGGPICRDDAVLLSASFVTGASYNWWLDANRTVLLSNDRNAFIQGLQLSDSFFVEAVVNGCVTNLASTFVTVFDRPVVTASFQPTCTFDTLFLNANSPTAVSYWWSGPVGFTSHLANPNIPNIHSYNAGSYVVTVTDVNGCETRTTVEVDLYPKPPTPLITHNAPFCVGTNLTLQTSAYYGDSVQYFWQAPNGTAYTTLVPSLVLNTSSLADTGLYSLRVWVDGCLSLPAESVIRLYPRPLAPNIPANQVLCEGDTLLLRTTNVNTPVTSYFWSGANGFQSNLPEPSLRTVSLADSGQYRLHIANEFGCLSPDTSLMVQINPRPVQPLLLSNAPICTGTDLGLSTPALAAQYLWHNALGRDTSTTTGQLTIPTTHPNLYVSSTWILRVRDANGCLSPFSSPQTTQIDVQPLDAAFAGNDLNLCNTNQVVLQANNPSQGMGRWELLAGSASISNPMVNNPTVFNLGAGTNTLVWRLSNGACLNYSTDTLQILVTNATEQPNAGINQVRCGGSTVVLNAQTPVTASGRWTQTSAQAAQGVTILDPTDPSTTVAGLVAGNTYQFTWTLSDGACRDYASSSTAVTLTTPPPDNAFAGLDINLCGSNSTLLQATTPVSATGRWTTNGSALIANPTQAQTSIANLPLGTTVLYWTLSSGNCLDYSTDSVQITVSQPVSEQANAGLDSTFCNQSTINLWGNTPNVGTGRWTQSPSQASAGVQIVTPDSARATAVGLRPGQVYTFRWTLSNGGCVDYSFDEVLIRIDAQPTERAFAGTDQLFCTPPSVLNLGALPPSQASGFWTTNSSGNIINPANPNSAVANLPPGVHAFVWTLSNGLCVDYSSDTVLVEILSAPIDQADAGLDTSLCNRSSLNLYAATPIQSIGNWSQTPLQAGLGVQILNPSDPNTSVQGLQAGQSYRFVWSLSNGPCADYDRDTVFVQVSELPLDNAFAGENFVYCGSEVVFIEATAPLQGTGRWTSPTGARIVSPDAPRTEVLGLSQGLNAVNVFVWSLSNGACRDYSRDTLRITVDQAPVANNDTFRITYNSGGVTIDVTQNDQLVNLWEVDLLQNNTSGQVLNNGDGSFQVLMTNILGNETFSYRLCNINCPEAFCDTAQVLLRIEGGTECKVPNIFTPNGDGVNDAFVIPCLTNYQGAKLYVFNRWGEQVYFSDNYQNDWQGTYRQEALPDATYFYILQLPDASSFQGFVELRR